MRSFKKLFFFSFTLLIFGCFSNSFASPTVNRLLSPDADQITISDADWGIIPVGVERPKDVDITNLSSSPITITAITWEDKTHFTRIEEFPLPQTIGAGETYSFIVYYKPDKPGVKDSTRAFFTATVTEGKLYSDWVGRGSDVGPTIVGYDFGKVRVIDDYAIEKGISQYKFRFSLKNIGGTKFTVKKVEITNDPDGAFTYNEAQIPEEIEPQKTVDVDLVFIPKAEKVYNAKINMTVDLSGTEKTVSAILTGIGGLPHISFTGFSLVEEIYIGKTITGKAAIRSSSLSTETSMLLNISEIVIEGEDASAFVVDPQFLESNPYPFVLEPGNMIEVPVIFTAQKVGLHSATLKAINDAQGTTTVDVSGKGKPSPVSVTSTDFGTVEYKDSTIASVYLSNNGSEDIVVNNITIGGTDAANFTIDSVATEISSQINPNYPVTLGAGDKIYAFVKFKPTEERIFNADVIFEVDVFGDFLADIAGEGIAPDGVEIDYSHPAVNSLSVYPAPISECFNLEFNLSDGMDAKITIVDIFGREIFTTQSRYYSAGQHSIEINLPSKPASGVYYIIVGSDDKKSVLKTIVTD